MINLIKSWFSKKSEDGMDFLTYKPTQNIETDGSVYADIVNHCKNYKAYVVAGSKVSSSHEITHCINADIRNGAIVQKFIDYNEIYGSIPLKNTVHYLYVPAKDSLASSFNAFYVLKDRAIKINEPNCKKNDCIKYIPESIRNYRFKTYIQGQQEWNDSPLYVFDEWVAYTNDLECSLDEFDRGRYKEQGTDNLMGPVEFIPYATAVVMAANNGSQLDETLKNFTVFQLQRVFDLYNRGKDKIPWADTGKIIDQLLTGNECADIRTFWKDKLNFDPTSPAPDSNPFRI